MVNDVVYGYLKENFEKYDVSDLKKMILSKGYSEIDYVEALAAIKMNTSYKGSSDYGSVGGVRGHVVSEKSYSGGFRWIFFGFFCGIILTLFSFLLLFKDLFPTPNILEQNVFIMVASVFVIVLIIFVICKFFVLFAFRRVGRYSDGMMLKVFSLVLMIVFILMVVIGLSYIAFSYLNNNFSGITGNAVIDLNSEQDSSLVSSGSMFDNFSSSYDELLMTIWESIPLIDKIFWGLALFLIFIYLFSYIFFSIGLIRIRKKVKLSLTSGIFRLILTLAVLGIMLFYTYIFIRMIINPIFIIQFFVSIASFETFFNVFYWLMWISLFVVCLFETIVLFLASRKYEKK